jgi:uncharacterized protein (TIGR03437 family)
VPTRVALTALSLLSIAAFASEPAPRNAPSYAITDIANLADGERGKLCPNTLAVIQGADLANGVWARQPSDLQGALLPTVLPGTGVTVKVNGLLAAIEYASPSAVVFLVPSELPPGPSTIVLTRNSVNGPTIRMALQSACPALFLRGEGLVLGRHADSLEWLADNRPAEPGEEVVLYAAGLGATDPPTLHRQMPRETVPLAQPDQLQILLNGQPAPAARVVSVALQPDTPGLYAIRLRLPTDLPPAAEVRLCVGEQCTRSGASLNAASTPLQPADDSVRSNQ